MFQIRQYGVLKGTCARATTLQGQTPDCCAKYLLRIVTVLSKVLDYLGDCHRFMIGMPAIVVRDQCDGRITDLRFTREFCFLKVRHSDDVHSPGAVRIGLCFGGELRTFHADICTASLDAYAGFTACGLHDIRQSMTDGFGECNVNGDAVPEKSGNPGFGSVEK